MSPVSERGGELSEAPSYVLLFLLIQRFRKDTAKTFPLIFTSSSLHSTQSSNMCCFGRDTDAACCLLRVRESVFCAALSFLQDVDIRQSRQHGIRTTDPLRQVDEGTMESFASLINNHTTKYEVTLIAQPTGVTQQNSGLILKSIASNTCYIVNIQHQYVLNTHISTKLGSDYRHCVHSVSRFTLLPSCCGG